MHDMNDGEITENLKYYTQGSAGLQVRVEIEFLHLHNIRVAATLKQVRTSQHSNSPQTQAFGRSSIIASPVFCMNSFSPFILPFLFGCDYLHRIVLIRL